MSISSREYSGLANDSYEDRKVGRRAPDEDERVSIEGVEYRMRSHAKEEP